MNTREKILDPKIMKDAMISKDRIKLSVIRFLKSEIQRNETGKTLMNENQVVNLIKKNIESSSGISIESGKKIINESARSEDWEKEVEVLESFLPKQMSEEEISTIIDEFMESGLNNMGAIMGRFTKEHGGKADGKLVSTITKTKLGI